MEVQPPGDQGGGYGPKKVCLKVLVRTKQMSSHPRNVLTFLVKHILMFSLCSEEHTSSGSVLTGPNTICLWACLHVSPIFVISDAIVGLC